jgi:chloramphenicol 3-O-phosphotransferase
MPTEASATIIESLTGSLIFLNGFPGVGKLTIARALKGLLPRYPDSIRLIDNHTLIDPAQAIIPDRGPAHKALRAKICEVVFEALKHEFAGNPALTVIMAGCLADTKEDTDMLAEHMELARACNVPLHLIDIECDKEEHMVRIRTPERYVEGKTKLSDETVLGRILGQYVLCEGVKLDACTA